MVGRRVAALGALVELLGAHAASISNCGGSGDIFKVSKLAVSPDPIPHREPFTITAIGKLSKDFSGGEVSHDLDIKVSMFGKTFSIDKKNSTLLELEPAVPGGDVTIIVGPVALPPIPGNLGLSGRVTIVDQAGSKVACVALDFSTPLGSEAAGLDEPHEPAESCRKPADHLSDVSTAYTADGWKQVTATFDEAITRSNIEVDLKLFAGAFPLPVKMNVPILFEPGIPEGELKIRTKPAPSAQALPAMAPPVDVRVVGNIVWADGKNEEITCVHLDSKPPGHAAQDQSLVV